MVLFLSMVIPVSIYSQEWKLHKNSDGIKSYTRAIQGSSFYECKGVAVMNAKIELLAEIIRDIDNYPRWFANCKEVKILKKFSPDNMFIYFVYDTPWPVQDRDLVVKTRAERDWKNGFANIFVEPNTTYKYPISDDYVRISELGIIFKLVYLSREETEITMIFKVDPAGDVPASLANLVTKNHPYKTLSGMKKVLNDPHYVNLGKKSVDRPNVIKHLSHKKRVNGKWVIIDKEDRE